MQDTSKIKERILSILRIKGPNFPSPIASEISLSILFVSAFLSELLSEKQIKITNMKVGSSPIYFIEGQEERLESFAKQYLKSKEKDAFILLQEKRIVKDSEQEPSIRVALRQIKDFAIPEEKNNEIYWRYFLEKGPIKIEEKPKEETKKQDNETKIDIFDKEPEKDRKEEQKSETSPKKTKKRKITNKKTNTKKDEKFFNTIKEYLLKENIEILDIIALGKESITLKVKKDNEEYLTVGYNKKRISEKEIIESAKKAEESGLKYEILCLGEPLKKFLILTEALKNMKDIKKINN